MSLAMTSRTHFMYGCVLPRRSEVRPRTTSRCFPTGRGSIGVSTLPAPRTAGASTDPPTRIAQPTDRYAAIASASRRPMSGKLESK